ncbi:hypothetical protein NEMBOFW57_002522 [Staphylotrichum longicolle]|uniref:Uncharacterized protein n=1 Tax=Staphylotrichum longicolle TaxID=669026 RepID=A0AAD4I1U5_9PEZI|nr:hypothetical protein NEMBOFW57_002522 [Staphylotrichum longicolle]
MPCLKRLLSSLIIFRVSVLAAPAPVDETGLLPLLLPEAAKEITASLESVRPANAQSAINNGDVLDDIERLLNIIGDHVDKICGLYNDKIQNGDHCTHPAIASLPTPDPVLFEPTPDEQDGHTALEADDANANPNDAGLPEFLSGANETMFTNITCKGISVCNPVTVFNEKGARRMKWSKIEKAMRQKAGKKTKA